MSIGSLSSDNIMRCYKLGGIAMLYLKKRRQLLFTLLLTAGFSTTAPCTTAEAKASRNPLKANQKVCADVGNALRRISNMPPHSYFDPLYVDSIEAGGRSYAYQNVDLDGDGRPDLVEQSCGSPSDGTCTLNVTLSTGAKYEVNDQIFHVMRFESKYYVLVGHSSSMKNHRRRLYALSATGAQLVCKSF